MLTYIKNIMSKPDARSDYKLNKSMDFHFNRLRNMHVNGVHPINLNYNFNEKNK
jgi:hypothetical protein